jgi:glyoxylase-like metal-dependent hydrolase (beta-lactamase superfamily II)
MADSRHVRQLGDIRVTAIADGLIDAPVMVVQNLDEAGEKDLAELAAGTEFVHPFVNAYLIETGGKRILLDSGAGTHMGPNAGKVPDNLKAAGVRPEEIDTILLSHCHPDHILGLVDADWNAVFANAELVVPEVDCAFWLEAEPSTFTNDFAKGEAERAQMAAAPYRERMRTVRAGAVAPGVTLEPLPGHSPGHSGYLIEGGGKLLCLWGDIVHLPQFQPAHPDASLIFDVDQAQARETRKRTFVRVIADDLEFGGGHILTPGFARLERAGTAYRIVPSQG